MIILLSSEKRRLIMTEDVTFNLLTHRVAQKSKRSQFSNRQIGLWACSIVIVMQLQKEMRTSQERSKNKSNSPLLPSFLPPRLEFQRTATHESCHLIAAKREKKYQLLYSSTRMHIPIPPPSSLQKDCSNR